ncbi:MAG: hypothetical protein DMG06_18590 [Acidobacteria bacterium]|nr:MAG: hypothetical protein DMG06_18590 [Acidobacteriota bacterium]
MAIQGPRTGSPKRDTSQSHFRINSHIVLLIFKYAFAHSDVNKAGLFFFKAIADISCLSATMGSGQFAQLKNQQSITLAVEVIILCRLATAT